MNSPALFMTREEALVCVDRINQNLSEARALLLELYERQGWVALGHTSWRECVTARFRLSESYLYRQLAVARLEARMEEDVGSHRESHLRPIIKTLAEDEAREEAYRLALGLSGGRLTAEIAQRAAWEVWVIRYAPQEIVDRMEEGRLSPEQAYKIGNAYWWMDVDLKDENEPDVDLVYKLAVRVSDPDLLPLLASLYVNGRETFYEIWATGHIPTVNEQQIAIEEATVHNLVAYLDVASAEHRAAHVERNKRYYEAVAVARDGVIGAARDLVNVWGSPRAGESARERFVGLLSESLNKLDEVTNG